MCCANLSLPLAAVLLRSLAARERIAAIADPGSLAPVDAALAAPRPSPHLARWGIAAQDDDGIVVARATVRGAPVFVAAQDERFLAGSAGVNHADVLRALFERARTERPSAVILLAASGGVRLHEANPSELALARALAALLDLRVAGVRVLALGVGDVYGGASVLACAADRIALMPGTRLALSGAKVIEMARGRDELDANDTATVDALFGAEARAAAGQVELIVDDAEVVREWIALGAPNDAPFATRIHAMQAYLSERLVEYQQGLGEMAARRGRAAVGTPIAPLPRMLSSLYANARPVDRNGWLWRMPDRPIWLTRPFGVGTFGPREAHALDAALLGHLVDSSERERATLFVVGDSYGHEATRSAEALCVSQYLAQHAAVLALLRAQGVRLTGLLTGTGHSAAFFANALQAQRVYALAGARVVAMEPAAIAHVTKLDKRRLAALMEDDLLVGQPVRHFAEWGGIAEVLPDASRERLLELAER